MGAGRARQGMPLLRQTHAATATAAAAAVVAPVARVTHLHVAGISRFLAGGSTAQSRKTAACTAECAARRGEAAAATATAAAAARSESSSGATTRAWPPHRPATRYTSVSQPRFR